MVKQGTLAAELPGPKKVSLTKMVGGFRHTHTHIYIYIYAHTHTYT